MCSTTTRQTSFTINCHKTHPPLHSTATRHTPSRSTATRHTPSRSTATRHTPSRSTATRQTSFALNYHKTRTFYSKLPQNTPSFALYCHKTHPPLHSTATRHTPRIICNPNLHATKMYITFIKYSRMNKHHCVRDTVCLSNDLYIYICMYCINNALIHYYRFYSSYNCPFLFIFTDLYIFQKFPTPMFISMLLTSFKFKSK